jgi:putative transposase
MLKAGATLFGISVTVHLIDPGAGAAGRPAQDRRWSNTVARRRGKDDGPTALAPIQDRFPGFADLLADEPEADLFDRLRAAESIGGPLGYDRFLSRIARRTGRVLKPGKRGSRPLGAQSR